MNNVNKQIDYWKETAQRDWKTALGLFKIKRYDACLFFCHLTLEKILKGLVVKQTNHPSPFIHDLEKLAFLSKLKLTEQQIQDLRTISTFNIAARYDNIKLAFYKKCTKNFTEKYLLTTKKLYLWLKREYLKK
ncbi:MAG: HEPN domain-containing protein [bacterium]